MSRTSLERVVVLTGGTGGIGRAAAEPLAASEATVILVGRDRSKGEGAVRALSARSSRPRPEFICADLSELSEVRRVAEVVLSRFDHLDVLINNAGAIFDRRETTPEGHERTWALNVLAPFLLAKLLLPRLAAARPSRIVNISSSAHRTGHLRFDDLEGARHFSGFGAYGQSKLALTALTFEMARRWSTDGVSVNALHPGLVASGWGHNTSGRYRATIRLGQILFGRSPARAARALVHLATSADLEGVTGRYFVDGQLATASRAARDPDHGARLWEICESQTVPPDERRPTDPS